MPKPIRLTPAEVAAAATVKAALECSGVAVPDVVDRMSRVEFATVPYDPATDWPDTYPDGGR